MATVKVKFRASSVSGKEGTLCYHPIHQRSLRQQLPPSQSVFAFFRQQIAKKEQMQCIGTKNNYTNAANRFMEFRNQEDLTFSQMTS